MGMKLAEAEYSPGDKYNFDYDANYAAAFRTLLKKEFANADCNFSVEAPENIYTAFFREGDRQVVHLLNAAGRTVKFGEIMKRGAPKEPFPLLAQDINISLERSKVSKIYAVSPDYPGRRELKFTHKDNICSFTLPKELLKAYTLIFID